MTKYLLLFILMAPVFHVEEGLAGMRRPQHLKCYLIRGVAPSGYFIHAYVYLGKDAKRLLQDGGFDVRRKADKDCDNANDQEKEDD